MMLQLWLLDLINNNLEKKWRINAVLNCMLKFCFLFFLANRTSGPGSTRSTGIGMNRRLWKWLRPKQDVPMSMVSSSEFWLAYLCPLTICIINTSMTLLYTYPSTHWSTWNCIAQCQEPGTHTQIHSRRCGGDTRYTSAGARDRKCTFEQVEFNGKVAFTSKRFFSVFHITDQGGLALNRWTLT